MHVVRACLTVSCVACLLLLSAVLTLAPASAALAPPDTRQRAAPSSRSSPHPAQAAAPDLTRTSTATGHRRADHSPPANGGSERREKYPGENWLQKTLSDIPSDVSGNTRSEGNPLLEKGKSPTQQNGAGGASDNGRDNRQSAVQTERPLSPLQPLKATDNSTDISSSGTFEHKDDAGNITGCANCTQPPASKNLARPKEAERPLMELPPPSELYGSSSVGNEPMMGDDPGIFPRPAHVPEENKSVPTVPPPKQYYTEDIQLGCRELRARRYITDGFCTSEDPIKEVVCAGNCLPIKSLPWFAEFIKTMARNKLREYHCVEDHSRRKRIRLLCKDGTLRFYRIHVTKSCRCERKGARLNRTSSNRERRKGRRKKRKDGKKGGKRKNKRRRRNRRKWRRRNRGWESGEPVVVPIPIPVGFNKTSAAGRSAKRSPTGLS